MVPKEVKKRDYTIPPYLNSVYGVFLDEACSCIITSASPFVTETVLVPLQNVEYITVCIKLQRD